LTKPLARSRRKVALAATAACAALLLAEAGLVLALIDPLAGGALRAWQVALALVVLVLPVAIGAFVVRWAVVSLRLDRTTTSDTAR
jgi:hypothetical protein